MCAIKYSLVSLVGGLCVLFLIVSALSLCLRLFLTPIGLFSLGGAVLLQTLARISLSYSKCHMHVQIIII